MVSVQLLAKGFSRHGNDKPSTKNGKLLVLTLVRFIHVGKQFHSPGVKETICREVREEEGC